MELWLEVRLLAAAVGSGAKILSNICVLVSPGVFGFP